jgi:cobalt/nickel transport system permease protein
MYRYMYVLVEEAQRLMTARDARSAEGEGRRAGGSIWWRARVTGNMIGTLFLRTYERSERIYQAMLARGFNGEIRTLHEPTASRWEMAAGAASVVLLTVLVVVANVHW